MPASPTGWRAAGLPLLAQHVDPIDAGTLVDIFRDDPRASLLGTDALRDGVDVPGESLRLVVMERVPWPRPTVLHAARRMAGGGSAYDDRVVRARLAQAFGRLIRRQGDCGAVRDPVGGHAVAAAQRVPAGRADPPRAARCCHRARGFRNGAAVEGLRVDGAPITAAGSRSEDEAPHDPPACQVESGIARRSTISSGRSTPRGWQEARGVGQEFKARRLTFDLVLASPAVRVRETLAGVAESYGPLAIRFEQQSTWRPSDPCSTIVRTTPAMSTRCCSSGTIRGLNGSSPISRAMMRMACAHALPRICRRPALARSSSKCEDWSSRGTRRAPTLST